MTGLGLIIKVCRAYYCWAQMYAGCVAYCPLVSHSEYAPKKTDGRQTVTLRLPLDATSNINTSKMFDGRDLSYRLRELTGNVPHLLAR